MGTGYSKAAQIDLATKIEYESLHSNAGMLLTCQILLGFIPLLGLFWIPFVGPMIALGASIISFLISYVLCKQYSKYAEYKVTMRKTTLYLSVVLLIMSAIGLISELFLRGDESEFQKCTASAREWNRASFNARSTMLLHPFVLNVYSVSSSNAYCIVPLYTDLGIAMGVMLAIINIIHFTFFCLVISKLQRVANDVLYTRVATTAITAAPIGRFGLSVPGTGVSVAINLPRQPPNVTVIPMQSYQHSQQRPQEMPNPNDYLPPYSK